MLPRLTCLLVHDAHQGRFILKGARHTMPALKRRWGTLLDWQHNSSTTDPPIWSLQTNRRRACTVVSSGTAPTSLGRGTFQLLLLLLVLLAFSCHMAQQAAHQPPDKGVALGDCLHVAVAHHHTVHTSNAAVAAHQEALMLCMHSGLSSKHMAYIIMMYQAELCC